MDNLGALSKLIREYLEAEKLVAEAEELLAQRKAVLTELSEKRIPDHMAELELSQLKLADGGVLKVEPFYSVSIPKDREADAYSWLMKNGFGDLIKDEIVVRTGRGEVATARKAMAALAKLRIPCEERQSVHHSTLRAFAREQHEAGRSLPEDLFNLFVGQRTRIKKGE